MEFRLIAVDLDGTAMLSDGRTLSERVERAFYKARERGIEIVLATGRFFGALAPCVRSGASWQHLCILCDGGEIRDLRSGEVLDGRYLKGSDLIVFVETANRLGIPAEIMAPERIYLTQESWEAVKRKDPAGRSHHVRYALPERGETVDDLLEFCRETDQDLVKAVYPVVTAGIREQVEEALDQMPFSWFWSSSTAIEVTHPEATKAKGLVRVCRMLGVPMEQTLAIGDSGNDIPMLREAGLGIAMCTAPDEVKAAAGAVTASNEEDGVALAIEKYVLHEEG